MKKLLFLTLFISSFSFGQGVRVGDSLPFQSTAVINGVTVIVPVPNATPQICGDPVGAVPCPNKVTTYTDKTLGTPCPTSTQVVLAGTSNCVAQADALGNWGAWVPSGNYNVTFTNAQGQSYGPIPVTANSSPNISSWSSLTAPVTNLGFSHGSNATDFQWYGGAANVAMLQFFANQSAGSFGSYNGGGGLFMLGDGEIALGIGNRNGGANLLTSFDLAMGSGSAPLMVQNSLACSPAGGSPTLCTTSQTSGALVGICTQNCGSGGGLNVNQTIAIIGFAKCNFDGGVTGGHWVTVSTTVAGDCHDAGASIPAITTSIVGRVGATNVSAGLYTVFLGVRP